MSYIFTTQGQLKYIEKFENDTYKDIYFGPESNDRFSYIRGKGESHYKIMGGKCNVTYSGYRDNIEEKN